jgi:5-methylcytosine-specific restriction endonuclease McrA
MQKYKKVYIDHFGYCVEDVILCEKCSSVGVDIHHVIPKGMGGSKSKDYIENLICLCRVCHNKAHSSKEFNNKLKEIVKERGV